MQDQSSSQWTQGVGPAMPTSEQTGDHKTRIKRQNGDCLFSNMTNMSNK